MKPISCAKAFRLLPAFYDGELAVADQIAVEMHVDWCDFCAATLEDDRMIGSWLRATTLGRDSLPCQEAATFRASVLNRRAVEHDRSLVARVRGMFEDWHLVYAGVGATAATVVCLVIMLGMMRFATAGTSEAVPGADERPDSLAAILAVLATPESSANAIATDRASQARGTARFQAANESAEEDAVFALAAIVTRHGQLVGLDRLRANGRQSTRDEVRLIEALLERVKRARIEPDFADGDPAPANSMVWLVTRTTVRATKTVAADLALPPPAKKRAAGLRDNDEPVTL